MPSTHEDKLCLYTEICDIIYPYLINENKILNGIFFEGPYELGNVHLKQGDVVIDAGANMGLFSAVASVKYGCKCIAFEPIPSTIDNYLSKTKELNGNITIEMYALSNVNKVLNFNLTKFSVTHHCADLNIPSIQKEPMQTLAVQAITLDDYVMQKNIKVDFIKADIEGSERYLLMGAQRVLKEFAPKISICTYHLPDDSKVLRELILKANPKYTIFEKYQKMYAYVEK